MKNSDRSLKQYAGHNRFEICYCASCLRHRADNQIDTRRDRKVIAVRAKFAAVHRTS